MSDFITIQNLDNENLGGLQAFNFVAVNDVVKFPFPVNSEVNQPIVLLMFKAWSSLKFIPGTVQLKEKCKQTAGGPVFEVEISFKIAKDSLPTILALEAMSRYRFLALTQDNNGLLKICGDMENPLAFTPSFDSKEDVPGRNEFSCAFTGVLTHKAYTYQALFDFSYDFSIDFNS